MVFTDGHYCGNAPNANGDRLLDILAPGSFIYSATSNSVNGYVSKSGTSMATPHVAGAWAVIKSYDPNASVANVLQLLRGSGKAVTDTRNNVVLPRINLGNAIASCVMVMRLRKFLIMG